MHSVKWKHLLVFVEMCYSWSCFSVDVMYSRLKLVNVSGTYELTGTVVQESGISWLFIFTSELICSLEQHDIKVQPFAIRACVSFIV